MFENLVAWRTRMRKVEVFGPKQCKLLRAVKPETFEDPSVPKVGQTKSGHLLEKATEI